MFDAHSSVYIQNAQCEVDKKPDIALASVHSARKRPHHPYIAEVERPIYISIHFLTEIYL